MYLEMIFHHGFYHADPHPGNLVVLPDEVIGLLDCGMVGRLDDSLREDVENVLMAIVTQDAQQLTSLVMRLGAVPPGLDEAALSVDLTEFVVHYANQPADAFDLAGALSEMIEIVQRYHIALPSSLAMLIKVLIMLDGTGRLLAPALQPDGARRAVSKKDAAAASVADAASKEDAAAVLAKSSSSSRSCRAASATSCNKSKAASSTSTSTTAASSPR